MNDKRIYFLTTEAVSELEFWNFYKENQDIIKDNWKCDEDDINDFKGDEEYSKLLRVKKKASESLDKYKELKRKN